MEVKHVFKKPFVFEKKEYKEISFDTDCITAKMIGNISIMMAKQGLPYVFLSDLTSHPSVQRIIAACAKLPIELIEALPSKDYMDLYGQMLAFFVKEDSVDEKESLEQ